MIKAQILRACAAKVRAFAKCYHGAEVAVIGIER